MSTSKSITLQEIYQKTGGSRKKDMYAIWMILFLLFLLALLYRM